MANKNKLNSSGESAAKQKVKKQKSDVSKIPAFRYFYLLLITCSPFHTFFFTFQDAKDYSSFKVVLFYCSLIVFLPVVTFFCLKAAVLDRFFNLTDLRSNIYSALGAVIALHLALGLYIYRAYFGGASKENKTD